jgi:hypothetical protein
MGEMAVTPAPWALLQTQVVLAEVVAAVEMEPLTVRMEVAEAMGTFSTMVPAL